MTEAIWQTVLLTADTHAEAAARVQHVDGCEDV